MAVGRVIAGDEILQVGKDHRVLFQREMHIRAKIVNPHFFGLRIRARRTTVKENYIRFDTRLVEYTGRQAQDRMEICNFKQFLTYCFACTGFVR